jgi:DNA-binding SARP family transcriptional activator
MARRQADVIDADRTSLALASSVVARIDTHAFEAACDAGDLDEALRLYGGDFLDGLSVAGCAAFEEWAFFRREALRSRLVQTLERLSSARWLRTSPARPFPPQRAWSDSIRSTRPRSGA